MLKEKLSRVRSADFRQVLGQRGQRKAWRHHRKEVWREITDK